MFPLANNGLRQYSTGSSNNLLLNWLTTFVLTHYYKASATAENEVNAKDESIQNYNVDDFLWMDTDYDSDQKHSSSEIPAVATTLPVHHTTITVFHTTTIMSTATIIYNFPNASSIHSAVSKCSGEICKIIPTPVTDTTSYNSTEKPVSVDTRYWLVTVLKSNVTAATELVPSELQRRLAKLYRIAFNRQQAYHLGLYNNSYSNYSEHSNPDKSSLVRSRRSHRRDPVTVTIYNVSLASSPTSVEILYTVKVSGRPVLATVAAHDMNLISDLEIVDELSYPVLVKAKPYLKVDGSQSIPGNNKTTGENRTLFYVGSSIGFVLSFVLISIVILLLLNVICKKNKTICSNSTDRYDNNGTTDRNGAVTSSRDDSKRQTNADNSRSEEISNARQRTKISTSRNVSSSNSYLSMPSVKRFPSASLPQPLSNMLPSCNSPNEENGNIASRNNECSRNRFNDPGVVSPVYCQFHKQDSTDDENDNCRSRYQRDRYDNFKMRDPYTETNTDRSFNSRSHEASGKTSIRLSNPRNAWDKTESTITSTTIRHQLRPASAGPFQRPVVHPEFILTDAHLPPSDPAITVITAIKQELDKVSSKTTVIPKQDGRV